LREKGYKMIVETDCKQCGKHIEHEANFIDYYCKCGNWIPILAFEEKKRRRKENENKRYTDVEGCKGTV